MARTWPKPLVHASDKCQMQRHEGDCREASPSCQRAFGRLGVPGPCLPARRSADQTARTTLPALRQRVHTRIRLTPPFMFTRTVCRLGSQRRFVRTWEWLTAFPTCGPFPHTSQRLDMLLTPFPSGSENSPVIISQILALDNARYLPARRIWSDSLAVLTAACVLPHSLYDTSVPHFGTFRQESEQDAGGDHGTSGWV